MTKILRTRWFLLIVLVIFIVFKIPHLNYPFYWDESWSYEPGVMLMYKHGPSLMPNAIDTFYSRGHPLLFYASIAAWMHVFGPSHFSQHCFSLFISLLLIVSVYEICVRLFNKKVANLAIGILFLQTMFFVQATFVLPEVMVALLVLCTLYFYSANKYILCSICCAALLLTKESGLVLGLVLGMHAFVNLFNKNKIFKERIFPFISICAAGIVIIGFFALQRHVNGWFLYPDHIGLMTWEWGAFWGKMGGCLDVIYFEDNRSTLFLLLLFVSLAAAFNAGRGIYAAPAFLGAIIYIIHANVFPIPEKFTFALLLSGFLIACIGLIRYNTNLSAASNRFISLGFLFIVLYLCFSSVNFMTARYMLAALIIVIIFAAYYSEYLIDNFYPGFYYSYLICILFIGWYGIEHDTGLGDTDLGAFDGMKVQEDAVRYLEKRNAYNDVIACGDFQDAEHLRQPLTGFLQGDKVFKNIRGNIDSTTKFVLVGNIEPAPFYYQLKNNEKFQLVYRTEQKDAWEEIYERK